MDIPRAVLPKVACRRFPRIRRDLLSNKQRYGFAQNMKFCPHNLKCGA
jgi:hypothetical protein